MPKNDPLRVAPFHFDADPDPAFHSSAELDPAIHLMRIQLPKMMRIQLPKMMRIRKTAATSSGFRPYRQGSGSRRV
jgi:hypothetical protein